jgi:hypothetical protein
MSLPLTGNIFATRCQRLARSIADDLSARQCQEGNFLLPEFYAKAFACALWSRLDRKEYSDNIERALNALRMEIPDRTYHREFIEYALHSIPDLSEAERSSILKNTKNQSPDVANWQILQRINRKTKSTSTFNRLMDTLHQAFIRFRYWRNPIFLDRPGCFSAQYHALCAALLSQSPRQADQEIAQNATHLIAKMTGSHGYANLLGRGAGQSFGAVSALYLLVKYGFHIQADAILSRIEETIQRAGTLPLNLLSPGPLPNNPGPANPATPGWYSYNRHDDYLAFAGFWLLRISELPFAAAAHPQPSSSPMIFLKSSPHYDTQMVLKGVRSFDISPSPVVVSGHGPKARLLLPPTGGEQDQQSLYGPASIPLPAMPDGQVAKFQSATRLANNRVEFTFSLAGKKGRRIIQFDDNRITIQDICEGASPEKPDMLRLLIDHRLMLTRLSECELVIEEPGIRLSCDQVISIDNNDAFTAAGAAQRITVKNTDQATLSISWENAHV